MSDNPPSKPDATDKFFSTVERIQARRDGHDHVQDLLNEQRDEYARAVNALAASDNGRFVLRMIVKYCNLYHVPSGPINPSQMIEDQGKKKVYLDMIRPFIETALLNDIER